MTEAIIITLIIVGGIVALAGIALHFGYKAWKYEKEAEKQADDELSASRAGASRRLLENELMRSLSAN